MKSKGIKYIAAGTASWLFDYGSLMLLYYIFHFKLGVATTIAFIIGFVVNFALIKYWVFAAAPRSKQATLIQTGSYGALTVANLLATNLIIILLSKKGIGPAISKIITTAMIACWNFFIYRSLIFKETDESAD